MTAPAKIARNDERWFPQLRDVLQTAVQAYDFENKPDFAVLRDLSEQTKLEGVAVHADSAIVEDGRWVAPATIYVTLVYEPRSTEPVMLTDSYPAKVGFAVDEDHKVEVKNIEVDVSSFYGKIDDIDDDDDQDVEY